MKTDILIIFSFFSGIKKYIVNVIIKLSGDSATMEKEKVYLSKLNIILVHVSKSKCLGLLMYHCFYHDIFVHKN